MKRERNFYRVPPFVYRKPKGVFCFWKRFAREVRTACVSGRPVCTIMGKWNETDEPIAYLITFRTYGTWLAGDERGSIDKYHNKFGVPRAVTSRIREKRHCERLKSPPLLLNAVARKLVESAIRGVCDFRGWSLIAISVRTNHVHVVVSGPAKSSKMLNDFKAYSTRRMREHGKWKFDHSPWVDKGSRRNLWTEAHVGRARNYVLSGQGGPLPEFD